MTDPQPTAEPARAPRSRVGSAAARHLRRTPFLAGLPAEVAVLSAIAFCVALGFGIVAPVIPVFAKDFGVSITAAAAVVAVFALARFVSAPPSGWLVNRLGERLVLATGISIVAVSSALAGLSQTYAQLLVLRGVGGFGSAMFTVSSMSLLIRSVPQQQRGRAGGAFQAGFLFGGVAGPAVGGLVVGISIRAPFFVYAGTLVLAVAVGLLFLRRPHEQAAADAAAAASSGAASAASAASSGVASTAAASTAGASTGPPRITLGRALRDRAYTAALGVNLSSGFAVFGLRAAIVPVFVVEGLRRGPEVSGWGFLAAAAVQAVLLLPAGRLADTRGRKPAMILGTTATTAGIALLVPTHSVALFLCAMGILGAGTAFLGSAPGAVVGDVVGGRRSGQVVAAYQMTSDLGAIVGPLAAGAIVDAAGFGPAFAFGAAVCAVALVMATVMPETLGRLHDEVDAERAAVDAERDGSRSTPQ